MRKNSLGGQFSKFLIQTTVFSFCFSRLSPVISEKIQKNNNFLIIYKKTMRIYCYP